MNLDQLFERPPCWFFAHREVFVIWLVPSPRSRERHAHAKAREHEREQHVELRFCERERLVEPSHHVGSCRERIPLVQGRVCHGDRGVSDREALDQVAEVDEARDVTRLAARRISQHVVVVGVVVNDAASEASDDRRDPLVPAIQDLVKETPPGCIVHSAFVIPDDVGRPLEIPYEVTLRRGVRESLERITEVPQLPTDVSE